VIADVVGIVTGVSAAVTIDVKGRPVSKRTLRLTDTRFNSFSQRPSCRCLTPPQLLWLVTERQLSFGWTNGWRARLSGT
jgi:type IV secretory pathway protease TraF